MLLGDQEHIEIRAESAADIGEQEIDGVEREGVEALAPRRYHGHSHGFPVARVMTVSGVPTLRTSQKS
jgi:hypothetical protein